MCKLGYKLSLETREKMRLSHLGYRYTPEQLENSRQAHLGKRHSSETRERIRLAHLGKSNGPHRPETIEKMRQAATGRHPSLETREKIRQARLRQILPTRLTGIERALRDEFAQRGLAFEMHKTMFGRFQPDFVFEAARLIVQADGDYWHSRPDKQAADALFGVAAREAGWRVLRFAEHQINDDTATCGNLVKELIDARPR